MSIFEGRIGVDISANKIQVVELGFNGNEFILNYIDEAYFEDSINLKTDKEAKIHSILQIALNEILMKRIFSTNKIAVTLPVELFLIHQLPFDNTLLQHDVLEEFKWEYSILYPHLKVDELAFQSYEIIKNPFYQLNSCIVAAINKKHLNTVLSFFLKNNFELKFVDNSHFAFDKALNLSASANLDGVNLSVFYAANILSVELLHNGKPFYYKYFKLNAISEIYKVIEHLLTGSENIKVSKNEINVIYFGGEEVNPAFIQSFEEKIQIKVINFNPFSNLLAEKSLNTSKFYKEKNYMFASAAGISYRLI